MSVRVENGKYEFFREPLAIDIRRGGDLIRPWVTIHDGYNAIAAMMAELDAARVVLDVARLLGDDAPAPLKLALRRHAALVDDREPPSEWATT